MKRFDSLAFVDLETTGSSCTRDQIIEIGIVRVTETGIQEWHSMLNPHMQIPLMIKQLTGINNSQLEQAPDFADIAKELFSLLTGCVFVAHNARFDLGFLKNAFKRVGLEFAPSVLCTVRLSRTLHPQYSRHNLDSLIERHRLSTESRHRALDDARLVYQFWQRVLTEFDEEWLSQVLIKLIQHPTLPSHLDFDVVKQLPQTPGVYLFYGENELPLYIGKSINLKQRVMSHFSADHRQSKEMRLSQQIKRIDWQETQGEIGALLLEAQLIKQLMPVHNQRLRRKKSLCAWQIQESHGQCQLVMVWDHSLNFGSQTNLYGMYADQREALKSLREMAEKHGLCLAVLGLEKTLAGRPCFAYQLRKCHGACIGDESLLKHGIRLKLALEAIRIKAWPYQHAVAIREGHELHVVHQWCYLGTAASEQEIRAILSAGKPVFDRDTYQILQKALKQGVVISLADQLT